MHAHVLGFRGAVDGSVLCMSDMNDHLKEETPVSGAPKPVWVLLALFGVAVLIAIMVWASSVKSGKESAWQERGEVTTATYVDRYYERGAKGGRYFYFEYYYSVGEDTYRYAQPVKKDEWNTSEQVDLPVCYDPEQPENVTFEVGNCGVKKK